MWCEHCNLYNDAAFLVIAIVLKVYMFLSSALRAAQNKGNPDLPCKLQLNHGDEAGVNCAWTTTYQAPCELRTLGVLLVSDYELSAAHRAPSTTRNS
jgi:hypothetical protein